MGKIKDLVIDQMNNQLEPPPNELNTDSGLCMWEIKSIKDDCIYKIWAKTYKEAVEMLGQIESF